MKRTSAFSGIDKWLRRRWQQQDDRFTDYIGDAQVWKTATAAERVLQRLQDAYWRMGITLTLVPVYREPRRFGDDALKPQD